MALQASPQSGKWPGLRHCWDAAGAAAFRAAVGCDHMRFVKIAQSGRVDVMLSLSLWLSLCFFSLSHTPSIPDRAAFPLPLIAQRGRILLLSLLNLAFSHQILCCERGYGCSEEGQPESPWPRSLRSLSLND